MATAQNGSTEIYYETHGPSSGPPLLLVNGLGSQLINWEPGFLELFVDQGMHVITFDNRDVGLSCKTVAPPPDLRAIVNRFKHPKGDGQRPELCDRATGLDPSIPPYTLHDMAADAFAVLDSLEIAQAHIAGMSMGGAIVQRMAINHPERVRSMVSIMSATGSAAGRDSSPAALASLTAPVPSELDAYVDHVVETRRATAGQYPADDYWRAHARTIFHRMFHPSGESFQMAALMADGDRTEALSRLETPTVVIHGTVDPLITPAGGEATAATIPGAKLVLVEGMGHDMPPELWPQITEPMLKMFLSPEGPQPHD